MDGPLDQLGIFSTDLGLRLMEADMKEEALLCFICARNLEKVVSCWMDTRKGEDGPEALQVIQTRIVFDFEFHSRPIFGDTTKGQLIL